MFKTKVGGLRMAGTRTTAGRIVAEWKFGSPFHPRGVKDEVVPPNLSVEVAVHADNNGSMIFHARGASMRQELKDTDIERLRQAVEAELRFQHDALTGMVWTDWIEVEVRGKVSKRSDTTSVESQAELRISYRMLKRAVDSTNGKTYVINSNGIATDFPKPKKAGEAEEGETWENGWKGMNKRDTEVEYSYIEATAENILAIESLMGRLDELRLRLSAFLGQDAVLSSLSDLNKLLPALPDSSVKQ